MELLCWWSLPAPVVVVVDEADIDIVRGSVAEVLIFCGDPCRMDYVVIIIIFCVLLKSLTVTVGISSYLRPAGESKMRCDVDDARKLFFHGTVRPSRMWI